MEKLSVVYASALFDIALESASVDDFLEQAELLRDSLSDAQCQQILVHPHISAAEKQKFLKKIFAGRVHDDLLGFLFLTTEKNREAFIVPALTELIKRIKLYRETVTAIVQFADELDKTQVAKIKEVLSRKLNKKVEVSLKVDPSVIGGPYIYVDGYYLDWTVKKRFRDLTIHMKEGCNV